MELIYTVNGIINFDEIQFLRKSVGWTLLKNSSKEVIENSYGYVVCYDDQKVVGFVNIVSNASTDAYIQDLMVLPDYQAKGIGSKLIEMAIRYVKEKNIPKLSVIFDESLLGFYRKFGFKTQLSGRLDCDELVQKCGDLK